MKDRTDACCLPQGHANQSRSSVTVNITLEYMSIRHFQRKQPSHAYHVNTMAVPWQVAGGMIQGPLCHRYYKVPMKKKSLHTTPWFCVGWHRYIKRQEKYISLFKSSVICNLLKYYQSLQMKKGKDTLLIKRKLIEIKTCNCMTKNDCI